MSPTNQRITDYLGSRVVSARDICCDLGLEEFDITMAVASGRIVACAPPHGGYGEWYQVSEADNAE